MSAASSDPIKHNEIAEEGLIKKYLQKEFEDLVAYLPTVKKSIEDIAGTIDTKLKVVKFGDMNLEGIKGAQAEIKKATDLFVIYQKVRSEEAKANIVLEKQRQEEIKTRKLQTAEEEKAQKTKERSIKLTEQEIAQQKIDGDRKRDSIALLKATIIEMDKTVGTLQRLEAANTRLRIERKNLVEGDKDYAVNLKKINDTIDANNKKIIESSDKLKQQKLNVGNYTESIKKAFEGTGILGETINKYLGVIVVFSEKIEGLTSLFKKQKEVQDSATVSTEAGAAAQKGNAVAAEAATVAEKANAEALVAEKVATEGATVATNTLGKSLKALATNPIFIAVAAIAVLAKVVYDNVTATQAQKDQFEAGKEAAEAWAYGIRIAGVDAKALAKAIHDLYLEEKHLEDQEIATLVTRARLRKEAAQAREEATTEGKTTRERIDLLTEFIDKTKEAIDIELDEAREAQRIAEERVKAKGKIAQREDIKAAEEAKAKVDQLEAEKSQSVLRAQKQRTGLIKQYNDDTRKMLQDAQKQELELIDTFATSKAEALKKQLAKDLALLQIETHQNLENKKREQDQLGTIDDKGVDHTKDFQRELSAIRNAGSAKAKDLTKKTNAEIAQLNIDFQEKSIESERKFREDLRKLDESYSKTLQDTTAQQIDKDLQQNQFAIDNARDKVKELEDQRNYEISIGKEKYKLSSSDLKQYLDLIDRLEEEHYVKEQRKLNANAEITKQNEELKTKDAIAAVKDKYEKLKTEEEAAIRNKNLSPKAAKKEIDQHAADREQNQAKEEEDIKRNLAAVIDGINTKLNGDLDKSDQEHLKRKKETAKQEKDIDRDTYENKRKLIGEANKYVQQSLDGIEDGLQKQSAIRQAVDQKDIDYHRRTIDIQAKLASEGKNNVLAEEIAAADKAEERKIQDQKRALRQQENIAIAKAFTEVLSKGLESGNFLEAISEAGAAAGIVKAIFSSFIAGSAYEGTEDTGGPGNVDSKGGKLWVLHENERVLTKDQNQQLDGMSNQELVYKATMFDQIYTPQFNSVNSTAGQVSKTTTTVTYDPTLLRKIDALTDEVRNKPVPSLGLNGLFSWFEETERQGNKARINHFRQTRRSSMRKHGG